MLRNLPKMTATLGIWTIARFAALAVLATETLFIWTRRGKTPHAGPSRAFWALTPALILAGLCLWCSAHVIDHAAPGRAPVVAQLR